MMKNKIYHLGLISCLILILGALFKIQHWPYASLLLIVGSVFYVVIFLPIALIVSYKSEQDGKWLYIIAFVCAAVEIAGMLFKITHWTGGNFIQMISIPLPFVLFLPAYLVYARNHKIINYNYFIAVLFFFAYMAVMTASLSLNVSRDMIDNIIRVAYFQKQNAELTKIESQAILPDSLKSNKDLAALFNESEKLNDQINKVINKVILLNNPSNINCIANDKVPDYWRLNGKDDVSFTYRREFIAEICRLKGSIISYTQSISAHFKDISFSENSNGLLSVETVNNKPWEIYNFQGLRLVSVLEKLEALRCNVYLFQNLIVKNYIK
jgi:hypothetical protein